MVTRRSIPLTAGQVKKVFNLSAEIGSVVPCLVVGDARSDEEDFKAAVALSQTFPLPSFGVTDVKDREQWRAHLLAIMRRAVEVLEGKP